MSGFVARIERGEGCLLAHVDDLFSAALRRLMWTMAGMLLAMLAAVWLKMPSDRDFVTMPALAVAILWTGQCAWLVERRRDLAGGLWGAGLTLGVLAVTWLLRAPIVTFGLALLPMTAALLYGIPVAAVVEGVLVGVLWGALRFGWASWFPEPVALAVLLTGAAGVMAGWALRSVFIDVAGWALAGFERAQRQMEEARAQRLELAQTQEDLLHANRELAQLSDRLRAMYQVAEEARRAKEEFVANVSHELRTPLNMIIGFAEMITQTPEVYGGELPPALVADIMAIQRNSQHLARLVDDVLDLSQLEAGRMVLTKEWVRLQDLIEAATLAVRPLYTSKGLYLRTEIDGELPSVFCDGTRVRQVILNLLSNAGRFTERGGVTVRAWCERDEIIVAVSDTGPGIAPEDQGKLFQPFQQLDASLRRKHGGSGLGLAISKRFVEMHDGRMWLESELGKGTTFYFSLPAHVQPVASGAAADARRWFNPYQPYEQRTRRSKAPIPEIPPRYVVLERGHSLLERLRRQASEAELVGVASVDAAMAELERLPARALIVNAASFADANEELDRLKDLPYGTPTVMCWIPTEEVAARKLGVVRYLVKPVEREALLDALDAVEPSPRSVLIIDDEPEIVRLFSRVLVSSGRGYRVFRAGESRRALELMRLRRPDVVLLDLILPGKDGFQLLREKSRDPEIRDIPVIVISSRDPTGEPIVSDHITVAHGDGLSIRDVFACVEAVSSVLAPEAGSDGRHAAR